MNATEKQVNYALFLAGKAGMSTTWMNSEWKGIASMRERQGKVSDYLAGLSRGEISAVIKALQERSAGK